jgi:hypothetical protein
MFPSIETPRQVVADFRAAALSSGRYDLMSNEYTYPLTVYLNETPHVLDTAKQAWGFFQGFHAVLRSEGLDRMTAKIAAEGLPRGGRFRIWTDWFAQGPNRASSLIAATICYCTIRSDGIATNMIEFTRLNLPMLSV